MFIAIALTVPAVSKNRSGDIQFSEYQVKAAFLYNFIKFTDWPVNKAAEPNKITIGILGENPFGDSFNAVRNKPIGNKVLVITQLGKFSDLCKDTSDKDKNPCEGLVAMRKCHVLFVCKSERPNLEQIITAVSDNSVLTVGECEGFLEAGGTINFIQKADKLVFEINASAAKTAKIRISSSVLRLATRVLDEGST
jgi:hypothetical protein